MIQPHDKIETGPIALAHNAAGMAEVANNFTKTQTLIASNFKAL